MKKLLALSAALLVFCVPVFAENDVNVVVNGNAVDMKGVILESRTMVPVRGVMEELGYTVDWNADTKTATLTNGENTVKITAGEKVFCFPFVSNPSFLFDERSGACCPRRHGRGIVPVHRADRYRGCLSTGGSSVSAGGNPVSFRWYG